MESTNQSLRSIRANKKGRISVLMVEVTGFEPTTSWSRTMRATKLRYTSARKMIPHSHFLFNCFATNIHESCVMRTYTVISTTEKPS